MDSPIGLDDDPWIHKAQPASSRRSSGRGGSARAAQITGPSVFGSFHPHGNTKGSHVRSLPLMFRSCASLLQRFLGVFRMQPPHVKSNFVPVTRVRRSWKSAKPQFVKSALCGGTPEWNLFGIMPKPQLPLHNAVPNPLPPPLPPPWRVWKMSSVCYAAAR